MPTAISGVNLAITAIAAALLYSPYGIGGIVAATVIATAVSVFAQVVVLRRQLGGWSWAVRLDDDSREPVPPRPWQGRATGSGTCSTTSSGAG